MLPSLDGFILPFYPHCYGSSPCTSFHHQSSSWIFRPNEALTAPWTHQAPHLNDKALLIFQDPLHLYALARFLYTRVFVCSLPPLASSSTFFGLPCSSAGKEPTCNAGYPGLMPGSERSPGEEIGYPLQYSWASWWLSGKRICLQCGRPSSVPGVGR